MQLKTCVCKGLTIVLCMVKIFLSSQANANPYPFEDAIQKDKYSVFIKNKTAFTLPALISNHAGIKIMRVHVGWQSADESYVISNVESEASGTESLLASMKHPDVHGSLKLN